MPLILNNFRTNLVGRKAATIWTIARHRIYRIRDRNDSGEQQELPLLTAHQGTPSRPTLRDDAESVRRCRASATRYAQVRRP